MAGINLFYGSAALAVTAVIYEANGIGLAAGVAAFFLAVGLLGTYLQRHP